MPEEQKASMDRFADELQRGFGTNGRLQVRAMWVRTPQLASRARLKQPGGYITRLLGYPLAVRRRQADLYHVCDHSYAHVAAFLPPGDTVITCHDLTPLAVAELSDVPQPPRRTTTMFRWRASHLARVAMVVCVSESTKRDVMRFCGVPEARLAVAAPGVAPHFRPVLPVHNDSNRGPAGYKVMHVSNGEPYKNVPGTLAVVSHLREAGLDVSLVRVGPPLRKVEQQLARSLKLGGSIVEHGRVSEEALVRLYNEADVLLFPSHYEGFGWPPLEAMASGTPVVASDCPALVELVGDAGLIAPARDSVALADATRSILESDELRNRLRMRGLTRAASYSWDETIGRYAQVYEGVIAGE